MAPSSKPPAQRFVSLREAAAFIGHTDKALRKLVERPVVPFRRAGRRLIFDLHALEEWLAHLPGVSVEEAVQRKADRPSRLPRH